MDALADEIDVTWAGFRGFVKETHLRLPRLTLLLGRNNVGKTSAYAPLLLLRQTLDARSPSTALLSRGELIDVGPFRDYVSNHDSEGSVRFRLELPASFPGRGNREAAALDLTFRSEDGQAAFLARHRVDDQEGSMLISRTRNKAGDVFKVSSPLLPKSGPGRPVRELTRLRKALREERPNGFLVRGYGALVLPRDVREDPNRWARVQGWYQSAFDLYELQSSINDRLYRLLMGISYIGPLRSLPLRTYRLAPEAPADVGGVGEHAPELLYRFKQSGRGDVIDEWIEKLGYGKLRFKSLNDEYFQLEIEQKSGTLVNVADSGIGLSQVLPLLVQSALAGRNSTVIAQQPEIHLNPAQQTVATDFLVERAVAGVRVIIESHSEHVLLRLRRRIAEGKISADEVAIYFVDHNGSETRIRPITMGGMAQLSQQEWPIGFFGEQLDDAFALAKAQAMG